MGTIKSGGGKVEVVVTSNTDNSGYDFVIIFPFFGALFNFMVYAVRVCVFSNFL